MSVVRDFCGHGLGRLFHDEPNIVHVGRPGEGIVLRPGMFFTVEPMINLGRPHVKVLSDGWTAVTRDRSLSAQFEHTIGVTGQRRRNLHHLAQGPAQAALPRLSRPDAAIVTLPIATTALIIILTATARIGRPCPARSSSASEGRPRRGAPHYLGHRERLRARFRDAGADAVTDYELLELVLFRTIPQRDIKPLAKELIAKFGSFAEVLAAPAQRLEEVKGIRRRPRPISRSCRRRPAGWRAGRSRSGRCCRPGRRCSTIAAPPWRSPTRSSSASCSSTSATR